MSGFLCHKIFKQPTQTICIDLEDKNRMIIQLLVLTFQDYLRKNYDKSEIYFSTLLNIV